jgi:hypothetical protein
MTCIVGIEHEGGALLACDSMTSDHYSADVSAVPKLFRIGEYAFGFTSSWRMGDLLRYHLALPPVPRGRLHRHITASVVPLIRACFKDGGFATTKEGAESGGTFLLAVRGHVYQITDDYQVGRSTWGYAAVGSGAVAARGALSALTEGDPRTRARAALVAAERHTAHVRRPWRFMETASQ